MSAATFPAAWLSELRARTPTAAVIGRRVKLARSGPNCSGCCPFHDDKTPSFYVYSDGYHCFACGAHGDAIDFRQRTEGLDFRCAVENLAAEAGLELPHPIGRETAEAAAAAIERAATIAVAQALWEAAGPITGTLGERYLIGVPRSNPRNF